MVHSMSQSLLPSLEIGLNALSAILEKAEAFAAEKKIDQGALLSTRLYPNMLPLSRQVQIASDQAKNGASRLAGIDPPRHEDTETTLAQLRERVAKSLAHVKSVDAKAIDSAGDRDVTFPLGPVNKGHMKGEDYLNHFVLPNFYFHITTTYAILRQAGLDIGKSDFLGKTPMTVTQPGG
jgi:hypothetical protein